MLPWSIKGLPIPALSGKATVAGFPLLISWQPWIGPAITILLGLLVGIVMERVLIGAVRKVLSHTALELNDHIVATLRGVILWLMLMWGAYVATYGMPFVPESNLALIRHVVFVMAMLLSIRLLAQMAVAVARFYLNYSNAMTALPNTSIFENLIRCSVYVLGLLMLLQTLGVSIVPIVTTLGVGGLAISLALQDSLANLFTGIQMLLARQIRVGDTIQLENSMAGEVIDIAWRTTTLRQLSGNLVILPNNKLASNIIVNYSNPHPDLTVSLQLAVPLTADLQRVEEVAVEEARTVALTLLRQKIPKSKGRLPELNPLVRYLSYGESWINMAVQIPFTIAMDGGLVRHELFKALHRRFVAEGISLPFPQNIVHLDFPEPNSASEKQPSAFETRLSERANQKENGESA
jgi:small-conductance mechanosensitive channel